MSDQPALKKAKLEQGGNTKDDAIEVGSESEQTVCVRVC